MLGIGAPGSARDQSVSGEVHVELSQGFARVLLHLSEPVESEVNVAGGIVVVHFQRPVDIAIDKLTHAARDYVGAARRDPDGRGFRIALNRRVTVNSMAAGERLYIDLLPDTWKGMAPGLPTKVIEELSRRAREAERTARERREIATREERPARVRVAMQPTFTRYVFELPDIIPVSAARGQDDITLTFSGRLKFDFGEFKSALPPAVKAIESFDQTDSVAVRFALNGKADIRAFREDRNYVLDIGKADAKEAVARPTSDDLSTLMHETAPKSAALADIEAPQTVPSAAVHPARVAAQAAPAPASRPVERAPAPAAAAAAAVTAPPAQPTASPVSPPLSEQRDHRVPVAAKSAENSAENKEIAKVVPALSVPREDAGAVTAEVQRQGDKLQLTFPFQTPTPAAIFRRAGTLWMVFGTRSAIALPALDTAPGGMIRHALGTALPDGYVVRLMLDRPRLVAAKEEGGTWTITLADTIAEPSAPLSIDRSMVNAARPSIVIPLARAHELHRIADPDMGDTLLVVTAPGPARGFIRPQEFVEFRALASTHGIAVQPLADDVQVELSDDNVVVARPGGLTLSGPGAAARTAAAPSRPVLFDQQAWGFDRQANLLDRQNKLIASAADAPETKRNAARLELARFYLAREMYPEARGVLDLALSEERPSAENPSILMLRAITSLMLNRPEEALKELNHPMLGDQFDAPLWRAFAKARLGDWQEALRAFKKAEGSLVALPVELQRLALKEALRAAIEVHDYETAQYLFNELQTIGTTPEMQPSLSILQGRLEQGLGKTAEALRSYRQAAESDDRPSATQGKLRELSLRYDNGDISRADLIAELEVLSTIWRGDETEVEALHKLARLYTEEERYRDAFHMMRTALKAHPNAQISRRIYDEAVESFDSLFLAGRGDSLPAIEALSLFYDFRELTPIGRRGDEMIRRLADRLVAVDLLPQAAELLQHQVDNRLQGAARAQVATRLAVIYLMDHKPERAQAVLRATRGSELNTNLRRLRLMLEARALSDTGRHDVALEVIEGIDSREAMRLRADILWSARRYSEAAEQIERMLGGRWKDFAPLSDLERADLMRAAIGYALGGDAIGTARLKERYVAKMKEGPDHRSFEIATDPYAAKGVEFRDLAKSVTAFSSLESFLREMRRRYPEIGPLSPGETHAKIEQRHTQLPARPNTTASAELTPGR
jgi:tetratricopeptide (TPR) repeat protein